MAFPPTDVDAAGVVDAAVDFAGDWPAGEFGLAVLHGESGVGREQDLVLVVLAWTAGLIQKRNAWAKGVRLKSRIVISM